MQNAEESFFDVLCLMPAVVMPELFSCQQSWHRCGTHRAILKHDEPLEGEQSQWSAFLELCLRYAVAHVFVESLVPLESLPLSETCMFARDVLCGPRHHQFAPVCE